MMVIAYGKQASFPFGKAPETTVLNAFHNPLSLISDFDDAEKTLGIFRKPSVSRFDASLDVKPAHRRLTQSRF